MAKQIAFVVHEPASRKLLKSKESFQDTLELFRTAPWGSRPNSTTRLTLANVKAVQQLEDDFDVHWFVDDELNDEVYERLRLFDLIIVNAIASNKSIPFTGQLLERLHADRAFRGKVVVGTEATWSSALKNGAISKEQYEAVYFGDCVLRHTARTDREIYGDNRAFDAVVQEFELPIDTDLFSGIDLTLDRKLITFVRAPEGRQTKNNEAIDPIISLLKQRGVEDKFEIRVIEPPYSLTEYWEILSRSAFLVFTSLGETFSYALNDAKALGVVTFLTEQMYMTTVGRRFSVDGYPELGIRYSSFEQIADQIERISSTSGLWELESQKSRQAALERFGLGVVRENWRALFAGENLNRESLLVYYGADDFGARSVEEVALEHNCRYVMNLYNTVSPESRSRFFKLNSQHPILDLSYYVTSNEDGQLTRLLEVSDGHLWASSNVSMKSENFDESAQFMQLVVRSYKIHKVVTSSGVSDTFKHNVLSKLTFFAGLERKLENVEVVTVT